MHISEKQIESVINVLKNNEYRLSDGYVYYYAYDKENNYRPLDCMTVEESRNFTVDSVLREVALAIIEDLNSSA